LPGAPAVQIIRADSAGWLRVALFGLAIGFIAGVVVDILGAGYKLGLVGLASGAVSGTLLAVWLWGEAQEPHDRIESDEARALVAAGHPVVVVTVGSRHWRRVALDEIERSGGTVEELRGRPERRPEVGLGRPLTT
jgi:hypothetical protein